ncbi:hypothetical protein [Listeria costaricensis]|uniref:hypothetical protein n=1 Tax=Listeria costaricensis TaxID=2026604 RepID=UPI000C0876FB|nr:hypothetical protein [Listeria costaricensis]
MSFEKLVYFYKRKLGNWNLLHSFLTGWWKGFLLLSAVLVSALCAGIYFLPKEWLFGMIALFFILFILFFYLMIYRPARKWIRTHYQLRSFKEILMLREYLLYAYLAQNGFETRDDLEKLKMFVRSEGSSQSEKRRPFLTQMLQVFIAAILAIMCGSFFFELETTPAKFLTGGLIILSAVCVYLLLNALMRVLALSRSKRSRNAEELIRQIIRIQTALLVQENTTYHPYITMEKKVRENDFLTEMIFTKSFI